MCHVKRAATTYIIPEKDDIFPPYQTNFSGVRYRIPMRGSEAKSRDCDTSMSYIFTPAEPSYQGSPKILHIWCEKYCSSLKSYCRF